MPTFFSMPKLGLNMTEGTIVRWLVSEGDVVQEGKPVLEIETDKATQEVEAPVSGTLARIVRGEGVVVPCNQVIAVILSGAEPMPDVIPSEIAEGVAPTKEVPSRAEIVPEESSADTPGRSRRVSISPSAQALATELGVDISTIVPKANRIRREDVEEAFRSKQQAMPHHPVVAPKRRPVSSMRRKISEHMSLSAHSVARVGLTVDADASQLIAWRESNGAQGLKPSFNVLLAKLVAMALVEHPYMNAQLDGDEIVEFPEANIGVAVDTERGLMVPILRSPDKKSVLGLEEELSGLIDRATRNRSSLEDLEGGTFTITNLGSLGVETFLPVVNYPECGILGVGAIIHKPVASDGHVEIRPRMKLTLSFDHRLVDGAPAARFLRRVKELVEQPEGGTA